MGSTYQISPKRQLIMDLSVYRSEPVEGFTFTDAEKQQYLDVTHSTTPLPDHSSYEGTTSYNLTTQYIANDVFGPQDLHIVGIRFNKYSNTYDDYVLFYNGRLASWYSWNPRPRFSLGYRNSRGGTNVVKADRIQISPSVKVDRRWGKAWVFELELGYDGFYYEKIQDAPADQDGYYFRIGYHFTF